MNWEIRCLTFTVRSLGIANLFPYTIPLSSVQSSRQDKTRASCCSSNDGLERTITTAAFMESKAPTRAIHRQLLLAANGNNNNEHDQTLTHSSLSIANARLAVGSFIATTTALFSKFSLQTLFGTESSANIWNEVLSSSLHFLHQSTWNHSRFSFTLCCSGASVVVVLWKRVEDVRLGFPIIGVPCLFSY